MAQEELDDVQVSLDGGRAERAALLQVARVPVGPARQQRLRDHGKPAHCGVVQRGRAVDVGSVQVELLGAVASACAMFMCERV